MINFHTLRLPDTPNYYLVAPEFFCTVKLNKITPAYCMPASTLAAKVNEIIKNMPRMTQLDSDPKTYQYAYIQKSFLFRFPDYIYIQVIPISEKKSTIAIYSHAKYGYSDFGVNQKRVEKILAKLVPRQD
ncbi:MAG: hypothetical protein A3F17_03230 [Gammaproteobacteria bacterium RIFCSPHIGHO2_12_FULL_41_15]|nr:MAG: hypothetical protein A3F17_03230 [Gammaproteobacteria bacterium RIFCSPHIGHO2_12_FULL_41_15]